MSAATVLTQINTQVNNYLPAIIAGAQILQTTGLPGETKFNILLDHISGIAGAASQIPTNPTVAGYAALINFAVSLFKAARTQAAPAVAVAAVAPVAVPA